MKLFIIFKHSQNFKFSETKFISLILISLILISFIIHILKTQRNSSLNLQTEKKNF